MMHRNDLGSLFGAFGGLRIVDSEMAGEPYEDWSQVRSHGRAARRRKRGFPQRTIIRYRANGTAIHDKARDVVYMHPHDRMKLERMIRERD